MIGIYKRKRETAHQEPSAIGVSRNIIRDPKYIGWRIIE